MSKIHIKRTNNTLLYASTKIKMMPLNCSQVKVYLLSNLIACSLNDPFAPFLQYPGNSNLQPEGRNCRFIKSGCLQTAKCFCALLWDLVLCICSRSHKAVCCGMLYMDVSLPWMQTCSQSKSNLKSQIPCGNSIISLFTQQFHAFFWNFLDYYIIFI